MMTKHTSTFLAHTRAIWPVCLAFVLIGTLAGCGGEAGPAAPAVPAADGYVAYLDPIDGPTGDALLSVTAPGYGRWMFDADSDPVIVYVQPDQPIQFFWRAGDGVALAPNVTYRYGWNVNDPDDPHDPGWFGPPTTGYKSQQTQARVVWEGAESLTIERWDGDRLLVRAIIEIWGQPVDPRS